MVAAATYAAGAFARCCCWPFAAAGCNWCSFCCSSFVAHCCSIMTNEAAAASVDIWRYPLPAAQQVHLCMRRALQTLVFIAAPGAAALQQYLPLLLQHIQTKMHASNQQQVGMLLLIFLAVVLRQLLLVLLLLLLLLLLALMLFCCSRCCSHGCCCCIVAAVAAVGAGLVD